MKYPLLVLAGLLTLAACQSPSQQATSDAATTPGQSAAPGQALADSPGTAYTVYRGLLPGQPDSSTLHLLAAPRGADADEAMGYFGSYLGANGHPYTLQGQPSAAPDSVVLFDTSPETAIGPSGDNLYWHLRRQATGDLAGTVHGQLVRLRRVRPAPGALGLVVRYFADSAAAFPKEPKSPVAHFSLQALVPVGGEVAAREALADNLLRDLRGDSLGGLPVLPLPMFYKQQRQAFFSDYRQDARDSRPTPADTAGIGPYGIGLRYTNQTATYVLCQRGPLLSLGFFRYDFSGGAHGNYATTGASYDLRTGRRLRYADIFLPTAAAQLPALLGRAVRPLVGLQPEEPLDKQLLVNRIPVTHNVFLTPGGAVFIYQPYEIAAYAQGEIRVFLPLSELRPLLREGLPLPAAAGVATR